MKVTNKKHKENSVYLCDLNYGEVFVYQGDLYIKTDDTDQDDQHFVVCLEDGIMISLISATLVKQVEAEVIYEEYE